MKQLTVSQLVNQFKKAIILDFDKSNVMIIREGKLKCYPKKYFNKLVSGLNLEEFGKR